jgi:hypothetical protein
MLGVTERGCQLGPSQTPGWGPRERCWMPARGPLLVYLPVLT